MAAYKKQKLCTLFAVLLAASWQVLPAFAETTYSDSAVLSRSSKNRDGVDGQHLQIEVDGISRESAQLGADGETLTDVADYVGNYIVHNIQVQGNQTVPYSAIRKKILSRPGNRLSPRTVAGDVQAILAMGWFEDVQVELRETAADPQQVDVVFKIVENPVFWRIETQGNTKIETAEIVKQLRLKPGELANTTIINAQLEKVVEAYHKAGYTTARVKDVTLSPKGILSIKMDEGTVEKITVRGNDKIREQVILREMRFQPGDAFNVYDAQRSLQRLNRLGYFVSTNMSLQQGTDPNQIEVVVDVVEDSTITVGAGAGYSESERFFGTVSLTEASLFGTGDSASIQWELGSKSKSNYYFTYLHPWMDNKETSLGLTLYGHTHEYSEYDRRAHEIGRYDKKANGQEITLSRADSEYTRNELKFKRRDDKYVKPLDGYRWQYYEDNYDDRYAEEYGRKTTASQRRRQNFGETRSITFSRVLDSRDDIFFPRMGKRTSFSVEQAGFGGDFNFTKLYAETRYYLPQGRNVIAVELAAGNAWGDLPLSQRFALGGASLRGYEEDQFMGNSMLKATAEYRIPISDKVTTLLFVDSGYAWDKRDEDRFDLSKIKVGYGVGLRFKTPIGPARLDYGWGQDRSRFHFSFGCQF